MNGKITLPIFLFLFLALNLPAQEKLTPEEMFRWFPEGKYEGASFKNNAVAQESLGFTKLDDIDHVHHFWFKYLLLPEKLKENWSTMVEMNSVKIVVRQSDGYPKMGRGGRVGAYRVGEKFYTTNHFGYRMQVFSFPLDLNLKKLLLSDSKIERTDFSFQEQSIFFVNNLGDLYNKEDFYLYLTSENQIIACVDLKLLKKMLAAGAGETPGVLGNFPFPDLLDVLPELGDTWQYYDNSADNNAVLQKLRKEKVSEADIQSLKLWGNYLKVFTFDGTPSAVSVSIPPETTLPPGFLNKAQELKTEISQRPNKTHYSDRYTIGDIYFRVELFTDEYIQFMKNLNEELRKKREAKKKEKEAAKEEKKLK